MTESDRMPRLVVLATGGTIASKKGADGGASPSLTAEDLLAVLPPLRAELRPRELLAKDSSCLTLADMQSVSDAVAEALADPGTDGIVVMHGTDAMEETALLVQLQRAPDRPVIFTGAQFAADHPQSDGPGNLADAIALASAPGGRGVSLAFGGEVLPVWGLYKRATDRARAFDLAAPKPPAALPRLPAPVSGLRVDIVAVHPGGDSLHLDASIKAGAQGIVLAALGSGNATPALVAGIARAVQAGVPVIVSSRVPEGLLSVTYGGGGGGVDMQRAGAIHARLLRPGQARILLAALLAGKSSAAEISAAFAAPCDAAPG